jgi:hypothetical protein
MGVGAGMGRGIDGYFGTRKAARNDRIEGDNEERRRKLEGIMDPINIKIKTMELKNMQLEAELTKLRQPGAINDIRRGEETAVNEHDVTIAEQPGNMETARNTLPNAQRAESGAIRTEEIAEKTHGQNVENQVKGIEYAGNAQDRGEARDVIVADQEKNQYETQQIVHSVPDVVEAFKASGGNPAVFDDWYDEYIDDGLSVTTRRDPDNPDMYIMTGPDGNDLEPVNAEQLVKGFVDNFTSQERVDRMLGRGNLGAQPGGYRPDAGIRRSGEGYGGSRGTFKDRLFAPTYEALEKKYPDMEPYEIHLKTLDKLSQTGSPSDDAFVQKTRGKMIEKIAGLPPRKQAKAIEQMEAMIEQLQRTMDSYGADGPNGDGEGGYDDPDEMYESLWNVPTEDGG